MVIEQSLKTDNADVGILVIGDEVLNGLVLDTNSNWIEKRLVTIGVQTKRLVSIRDDLTEINKALSFLTDCCDVIITSGGLGPTHDDMTFKGVAAYLNQNLIENGQALAIVKRQYKLLHEKGIVDSPEITDSRKKMAQIPEGAKPLDNTVGGAPGIMIQHGSVVIFCLPGVPSELKDIFDRSILPWFQGKFRIKYYEKVVELEIRDESILAPHIDAVMNKHPGVYIKSMPKTYGTSKTMRVWVSSRRSDSKLLKEIVDAAVASLVQESGAKLVSEEENKD